MALYRQLSDTEFECGQHLHFEGVPALPFKLVDKSWFVGWDIPMIFVIDASNQCWKDDAHGTCLHKVSRECLLVSIHDITQRNTVRAVLGGKPEPESWMHEALKAGWQPADTWNKDEYDWEDLHEIIDKQVAEQYDRGEDFIS